MYQAQGMPPMGQLPQMSGDPEAEKQRQAILQAMMQQNQPQQPAPEQLAQSQLAPMQAQGGQGGGDGQAQMMQSIMQMAQMYAKSRGGG